ncbi:hypothetical protein EV175_005501, partial [Coemansia sp. RSA 1933]
RLHINPTFALLLRTRVVPPSIAFIAAAASTMYAVRYLYTHALDLLTNIIGVAYPAYQSIMAIQYGDANEVPAQWSGSKDQSIDNGAHPLTSAAAALGISTPNLDKKQWLMYWAIYGVLTTADHWAGPILRLFPMYRIAKIGVLVWAQHQKYNGAAWLYDTFVRPLLPPPEISRRNQEEDQYNVQHKAGMPSRYNDRHVNEHVKSQADATIDNSERRPDDTFSSLELPPSSSIWNSSGPRRDSSISGAAVDMFTRSAKDIVLASALKS